MSYSNSFPTQRPTLNLDFANSGKLDSRLSYSRSSGGTYLSSEKALSSENLLLQSENLGTTWSVFSDLSTPAGSQTSPAGDSTAWLLTADTDANASPALTQSTSTGVGTHTMVAHLKAGTASHGWISLRVSSGNSAYAMVDFSAGTSTHGSYGSVTNPSSTVTALGSDWYRLTLTATVSSSIGLAFLGISDGSAVQGNGYTTDWNSTGQTMFAWGAQLSSTNSKVYDSPTTTQISRGYSPLLKTASADSPRFEFATDGQSVGTAKGLLIEQQFTQLVQWSEEFDNTAGWSGAGISIQPNAGVAPDGTLSADLLVEADEVSGNNSHYARQSMSVAGLAAGQTYTLSVYAKAAGRNHAALYTSIGGANAVGIFSLIDGSNTYNNGNGTWSSIDCGNGWFRLQLTFTTVNANNHFVLFYTAQDATTYAYTGNGFGSVLFWGANLTQTASSMSYLKAEGSQTTKSADSCSVALDGILASGQDVTLYAEGDWGDYTVKPYNRFLAALSENTDPNWIALYNAGSSGASYIKYENNLEAVQTGVAASGNQKSAVSCSMNSIKHAAAGVASAEDTSATVPPYTQLNIGNNRDAGTLSLNGHCSRVALYGQALSSSELATLTS